MATSGMHQAPGSPLYGPETFTQIKYPAPADQTKGDLVLLTDTWVIAYDTVLTGVNTSYFLEARGIVVTGPSSPAMTTGQKVYVAPGTKTFSNDPTNNILCGTLMADKADGETKMKIKYDGAQA